MCLFSFPHFLNFPQFIYLFIFLTWRKLFLKPMLFIGGVAFLILYFLFSFVLYVYYLLFVWFVFANMWQRGGEIDKIWKRFFMDLEKVFNYFNLGGETKSFIFFLFFLSNLEGELVCFSLLIVSYLLLFYFILFICLYFHTYGDVLFWVCRHSILHP